MSVSRPNLKMQVRKAATEKELMSALFEYVLERTRGYADEDRAMIFCQTVKHAAAVAELFGTRPYHAKNDPEDNIALFSDWRKGTQWVIVSTSLLGSGTDYHAVRDTINFHFPFTAFDYQQQMDRAGRDDQPAVTTMFLLPMETVPFSQDKTLDLGAAAMEASAHDPEECLRVMPSSFFDGTPTTCLTLTAAILCGNCERHLTEMPPSEPRPMPPPLHPSGRQLHRPADLQEARPRAAPQAPATRLPNAKARGAAVGRAPPVPEVPVGGPSPRYRPPAPAPPAKRIETQLPEFVVPRELESQSRPQAGSSRAGASLSSGASISSHKSGGAPQSQPRPQAGSSRCASSSLSLRSVLMPNVFIVWAQISQEGRPLLLTSPSALSSRTPTRKREAAVWAQICQEGRPLLLTGPTVAQLSPGPSFRGMQSLQQSPSHRVSNWSDLSLRGPDSFAGPVIFLLVHTVHADFTVSSQRSETPYYDDPTWGPLRQASATGSSQSQRDREHFRAPTSSPSAPRASTSNSRSRDRQYTSPASTHASPHPHPSTSRHRERSPERRAPVNTASPPRHRRRSPVRDLDMQRRGRDTSYAASPPRFNKPPSAAYLANLPMINRPLGMANPSILPAGPADPALVQAARLVADQRKVALTNTFNAALQLLRGWHHSAFFLMEGYCFFCLIPQAKNKGWHGWVEGAPNNCPNSNIIKPALYSWLTATMKAPGPLITSCPFLPADIFAVDDNLMAFRTWASTVVRPDWQPVTNALRLFLWLVYKRGLPEVPPELMDLFQ
ncbi:hypothetical protein FB451DRAFT_1491927 [Mycena latifolia]|nr:hypothetical protein FB451DRAFT_1491927 [Mycena latifolia]